jgi:CHAD domain-containing protein
MELFTDFYGSTYEDHLKNIKDIQSILGEIQDSFVLAEFLTDTLNTEITDQLPTLAAQLTEARYQAWQAWQPLQQRYLNAQTRKDLHQTVLQPVSTED